MQKLKKFWIVCTIISVFMLVGCGEPVQEPENVYTAEFAQSPMEYMIFIDKEITPITNALTTQILLSRHVIKGAYPIKDAIDSAKSALVTIEESISEVDRMQPPAEYREVRENVLDAMNNCKSDIEALIKRLEESPLPAGEITSLISVMQGDFLALTGEFNVPQQ